MDPVLSTLFPVHQIGSDGFNWWIGQVESGQNEDPKNSGRYRVRIVGVHLKDCNATPTSQLPWANVMLPATTPWSDGGTSGSSIGYKVGSWVVGFFLDNEKQKPLIIGSIGHAVGATKLENVEKDPNPSGSCKSFTTYIDPEVDPSLHLPLADDKKNSDSTTVKGSTAGEGATGQGQAGKISNAVPGKASPLFYAAFGTNNVNNPHGQKICVEVANPNCGSEKNFSQGMKNIISDMLKANQDSDGQLGSYYVSKYTGELYSYIDTGKEYINKAIKLVKTLIARIKGEIVKGIEDGVDKLVEFILYKDVVIGNTGPVNPDLGIEPFKPITKKEERLKFIIDLINEVLDDVGCEMENLTQRIADYITDLLLDFLLEAYTEAICLVDTLVNGIINQIVEFIESALQTILAPITEVLGVIAEPLDLIGGVVNKVFTLLGISCDGPEAQCEKVTKKCVDCGDKKSDDDDWLDKLLDGLKDGPLDESQYICSEAKENPATPETQIDFIGGSFSDLSTRPDATTVINNRVNTSNLLTYTSENVTVVEGGDATFTITRAGNVTSSSSIRIKLYPQSAEENVDFEKNYEGSVIGFASGETTKQISFSTFYDTETEGDEVFWIRLVEGVTPENYKVSFPSGRDFSCTIQDSRSIPSIPGNFGGGGIPYVPPSSTLIRDYEPLPTIPAVNVPIPKFKVVADKNFYYENNTVTFFITGSNVTPGDLYTWSLDVDEEDIVDGITSGSFIVDDNLEATVSFVIAENNDNFRIDPAGTIPILDEAGDPVLDEEGNPTFNEEDIFVELDDLDETLTLTVNETGDSGSTVIVGENDNTPSYFVRAEQTSYIEGDTACFIISTLNVPDDTIGYWTLSGDISSENIEGESLQGEFTIQNGQAKVCINILDNEQDDITRLVTFSIDNTDASENFIILGDFTVPEEEVLPTYSVSTDKLSYKEGEVITYTITTTDVPDGTVFQWIIYGVGITPSDFVGERTSGTIVIIDNTATVYVSIEEDTEIEDKETLTFLLSGTNGFADVIIESELENVGEQSDQDVPLIPVIPCVKKPVAGTPITDELGSIISIPIISQGCSYDDPPKVIITGDGIGATGIALLDGDGKVSEIRVTRPGSGYKKNTSTNQNLRCIIDSFTLLSPGKGYTEAPSVFVNGEAGIAEAIIDDRGFVISVQVIDRSQEYIDLPKIAIQGGGGFGARVMPSLACLDTLENLAASGYAKIGTGKYIDCP